MPAAVQPTFNDRILSGLRILIREQLPNLRFLGTYEYVINATDGTTVDGSPTDATQGLADFKGWPMRSCVCGATSTPTVGSK